MIEVKKSNLLVNRLTWQMAGKSYTASGYGSKIPTEFKVFYRRRWRRIYAKVFGNSGMFFVIIDGIPEKVEIYE